MEMTIVLPIHNERDNLRPLFEQIERAVSPSVDSFEIIAVDDGSTDGSRELLQELSRQIPFLKVIFLRRNYGQSAAFDAGFRASTGRLVVTMDADLQNDPADIPKMVSLLQRDDLDFVAGNRKHRQDHFIIRKLPSRIANWLIRRVTGTKSHDLGCSLKLYRRELVQELRLYGEMHRFIGVLVEGLSARTGEIDVNHRPRHSGSTKYGLTRTYKVMLDLLTVWFMRSYQTKPIYVVGGIGILLGAASLLLSGFVLWEKLARGIWVHRNPLFTLSMMMFVIAVQFLVLGLLAEIIIRTYFESRQKPSYLIGQTLGFEQPKPDVSLTIAPWVRDIPIPQSVPQD
jgi:glycosyltransferase involved in cell wall biosynthesis